MSAPITRINFERGDSVGVLLYDPVEDAWSDAAPMPFASLPGQALLLSDGSVLVMGGGLPVPTPSTDGCGPEKVVGWTARFVPEPAAGD